MKNTSSDAPAAISPISHSPIDYLTFVKRADVTTNMGHVGSITYKAAAITGIATTITGNAGTRRMVTGC